jgi:hypothetical protein
VSSAKRKKRKFRVGEPVAVRRSKFKVGQLVHLPVRIVRIDRRWRPERYMIKAHVSGWILEDMVESKELCAISETVAQWFVRKSRRKAKK